MGSSDSWKLSVMMPSEFKLPNPIVAPGVGEEDPRLTRLAAPMTWLSARSPASWATAKLLVSVWPPEAEDTVYSVRTCVKSAAANCVDFDSNPEKSAVSNFPEMN